MRIEPLVHAQIDTYLAHLARHMAESGRDGTPVFNPLPPSERWDPDARRPLLLARWAKALHEPGWERAWAVHDNDRIVGHLDLRTRELSSSLHRATLGMGLEATHRRMGLGRALIDTAVAWAREQPSLDWVDLQVFAHNEPALRLYAQCGFVEKGRVEDLFRIGGERITDVQMTLRLR